MMNTTVRVVAGLSLISTINAVDPEDCRQAIFSSVTQNGAGIAIKGEAAVTTIAALQALCDEEFALADGTIKPAWDADVDQPLSDMYILGNYLNDQTDITGAEAADSLIYQQNCCVPASQNKAALNGASYFDPTNNEQADWASCESATPEGQYAYVITDPVAANDGTTWTSNGKITCTAFSGTALKATDNSCAQDEVYNGTAVRKTTTQQVCEALPICGICGATDTTNDAHKSACGQHFSKTDCDAEKGGTANTICAVMTDIQILEWDNAGLAPYGGGPNTTKKLCVAKDTSNAGNVNTCEAITTIALCLAQGESTPICDVQDVHPWITSSSATYGYEQACGDDDGCFSEAYTCTNPDGSGSDGLSAGAIAGIVIGSIVAVGVIGVVVWYAMSK